MDELNLYFDDSTKNGFYCLCGVVVFEKEKSEDEVKAYIKDTYGGVNTYSLEEHTARLMDEGLHYSPDYPLIRDGYIKIISRMGIRAEIAIANQKKIDDDEKQHQIMRIIKIFSQKYSNTKINVFIEVANYTNPEFKKEINQYLKIEKITNIKTIGFKQKNEEPLMSIADYLAGIVREYYLIHILFVNSNSLDTTKAAISLQTYNKIKNKIECIFNMDTSEYESRRQRIKNLI